MVDTRRMLALILGGGAGTRLFPLTQYRSKPAVPLGGKYRLIDVPISNCINSDVVKIFVLTQYNSASLNRHVSQTYRFSAFSDGFVEILAAEQRADSPQWFQGTADAVRQVLPHVDIWNIDTILILSGDHLYRMDYRDFLRRHDETDADVTISVVPCGHEEASEFGLMKCDETGRVTEFSEKPKGEVLDAMRVDTGKLFKMNAEQAEARPFLASMGIYVFKYEYLKKMLAENEEWVDFGRELIPAAIDCCNVHAHLFNGYWEDIGTISAFYRANLDTAALLPKFNLFDSSAPIFTRARYLPPSKVQNCEVFDSTISEGCIINGARITNSTIGLRSRIDAGAHIEQTVVMGADSYQSLESMQADFEMRRPRIGIGANSLIRRAIVDKNARIGAGVRLVNDAGIEHLDAPDGNYFIRDRIIIVPKDGVIYDGTVV
ncbi:MAG: glucose-1-phosphate adenylyltransferase [Pyrinomonadaceae bacterium MAG19_C2-C3]|nr:glucose-1-phosphate adenylyltransferase [Pyrinomonadaceae bacterium MAG19_C2-C3]